MTGALLAPIVAAGRELADLPKPARHVGVIVNRFAPRDVRLMNFDLGLHLPGLRWSGVQIRPGALGGGIGLELHPPVGQAYTYLHVYRTRKGDVRTERVTGKRFIRGRTMR